ncbi:hypothetical protein [Nocardia sp. CNY236]|uniref:hypothetical protein n=1 Tax=Nocardia sp. CNY236 TaxID=1169152 RepID=UPI0018C94ED1|nr:hypothetical protein [Nocardia sp. CNY236]
MSTYITAAEGDITRAMALYGWNARVSAALMLPSHFAEVTIRNAVSEALTTVYGSRWPWNLGLQRSLPAPAGPVYSPRQDLLNTRNRESTTGGVISELKIVFWQSMFTARHDVRVWNHHILNLFPNASGPTPSDLRRRIYTDLESIRKLRNRVAHHEPILARNLGEDLNRIIELIELRSKPAGVWVRAMEDVSTLLIERP